MDYLNLDVALAQLLAYFVSEKGYTIVSVQQDRDDLWLIQPKNRSFPILRLCRESREELQSKQSYLRQVNRVICDLIHREMRRSGRSLCSGTMISRSRGPFPMRADSCMR